MKNKTVYLILPLFLLSCSKKESQTNSSSQDQVIAPSATLPFQVTIVETPEIKEVNDISNQVITLLVNKDYDKLDDLAAKYRSSKECYVNGVWKLGYFYKGLDLSDETSDAQCEARFSDLRSWIQAKPDSITPRVALANDLVSYAWKARGSGWASTVSNDGWQLFGQRLNEAVETLNEAKSVKEECPCWWSVRLQTILGLQGDRTQYEDVFNQAIKVYPDYKPFYFKRAIYLLPRWSGSKGEWESEITKVADQIGGDNGDIFYAQAVWYMHDNAGFDNIFTENQLSWTRVDKGFVDIEKQFPDSLAAKNERAYLGVLACDAPTARKYFDQTEGKVDLSVWNSTNDFIKFANWAYGK
jgi:tetratricopeptide (TPR) repeat protein